MTILQDITTGARAPLRATLASRAARIAWAGLVIFPCCVAEAAPGSVELTSGGRVTGEVVEVYPSERVTLRLPDGSTMQWRWTEIRFVFCGRRVFDARGRSAEMPGDRGALSECPVPHDGVSAPAGEAAEGRTGEAHSMRFGSLLRPAGIRWSRFDDISLDDEALLLSRMPSRHRIRWGFTAGSVLLATGTVLATAGFVHWSTYRSCAWCDPPRGRIPLHGFELAFGFPILTWGIGTEVRWRRANRIRAVGMEFLRGRGFEIVGRTDAREPHDPSSVARAGDGALE